MSKNSIEYLSKFLTKKEAKILFMLMKNSRTSDSMLKNLLNCKSENTPKYYRKKLESLGIIERYSVVINWERLGFKKKFLIVVECKNKDDFHRIAKRHVFLTKNYLNEKGELVYIETPYGLILLKEVLTTYNGVGIIIGYAQSMDAIKHYVEIYIKEKYPEMRVKEMYIVRDSTVKDFFIHENFVKQFIKTLK